MRGGAGRGHSVESGKWKVTESGEGVLFPVTHPGLLTSTYQT